MRDWAKLYTEILRDPKMHAMPDHRFRVCINLIALAGIIDKGGRLGTADEVAFHLRLEVADTATELEELRIARVTVTKNGVWKLKNWTFRNGKPLSDRRAQVLERVHKHRKNKVIGDTSETDSNASVTPLHDDGNAPREDKNREEEIREEEIREEESREDAPTGAVAPTPPDPKAKLLIVQPILQEQLARYYEGHGRSVPRHYQSDQQRQAYEAVFVALGGELQALTEKAFARQMSSLPKLLAWLEGCAKHHKVGNGHAPANEPAGFAVLRARREARAEHGR